MFTCRRDIIRVSSCVSRRRRAVIIGQPVQKNARACVGKLAFHDADTDTDTDNLADILARIVARTSACRSACHRNDFRKSRVSDVSARILAGMSVSVSGRNSGGKKALPAS